MIKKILKYIMTIMILGCIVGLVSYKCVNLYIERTYGSVKADAAHRPGTAADPGHGYPRQLHSRVCGPAVPHRGRKDLKDRGKEKRNTGSSAGDAGCFA